MVMVSNLGKLELHYLDQMPRHQLIEAVLAHRAHLPDDLLDRVEQQSADHLRLLLLAARLIRLFRCVGQRA
jgi:hypothetical protein